jgi:hypothetical protein
MEDIVKRTKQTIENYEKAVKYLDECNEFDFDGLLEAHRIAGTEAKESDLREMWSEAKLVLPGPNNVGGVQSLQKITRDSLTSAITEFQKLVDQLQNL